MTKAAPLRSYGRIKGRPLKPRQARLLETLLPRIEIPAAGPIDPDALFAGEVMLPLRAGPQATAKGAALEIGFGGGEHLAAQAKAHPDWRFLGVEPFLNGVVSGLRHIEDAHLPNVRLRQGDARDVLARLANSTLDRVYILFPDPWPKKRHWKRRFISQPNLDRICRCLADGGELRFATDVESYAEWTREEAAKHGRFASIHDSTEPWEDWPGTRYEAKAARAGRGARFFSFRKNHNAS
jgi:tRNA (guanine-N7-)-methyltransferase